MKYDTIIIKMSRFLPIAKEKNNNNNKHKLCPRNSKLGQLKLASTLLKPRLTQNYK